MVSMAFVVPDLFFGAFGACEESGDSPVVAFYEERPTMILSR